MIVTNEVLIARYHVETLLYRYASVLDEGPLDAWPKMFTEQGQYQLIARENHTRGLPVALMVCHSRAMMEDRVTAIEKACIYTPHTCRHLFTNVLIDEVHEMQARIRANYAVYRSTANGETDLLSVGSLRAHVQMGSVPLFESIQVVYETCTIPGLLVFPI